MHSSIQSILSNGTLSEKKALFLFDSQDPNARVVLKFNIWSRFFFPQYFTSPDAPFHKDIDNGNFDAYSDNLSSFIDSAFRGAAKTARTKLMLAFCIANDCDHYRRYIKILSADLTNARQIVTDIFNVFTKPEVAEMYPEVFKKTSSKREEQMGAFTTSTGVKMIAGTVGTDQRGAIQEDARPDLILFEDFETRTTLRSAKKTRAIWENMEEARTGLAKDGSCIYNCNYVSEMGNVHTLMTKVSERKRILNTPIIKNGILAWGDRYSHADIRQMEKDDMDFEGERLNKPSASKDIIIDRETLDTMKTLEVIKESAGFKIFKQYKASHRYASGHDIGGGVGLDSSTSVFIDFECIPAQVVATYADNTTKPDDFAHEIRRQSDMFGGALSAPEKNNYGHATIAIAKQLKVNLFETQDKTTKIESKDSTEYGWHTNALTKPKMMLDLAKAIEDGLLVLNDPALISEAKGYSRNDLIDKEIDPRLTTRHFDLLIACAIAWQMKDFAKKTRDTTEDDRELERLIRSNRAKPRTMK